METRPLLSVSKFNNGFRRHSIFLFIICLLCFSAELAFGQKEKKDPDKKATICHNGRTIRVSKSAVEAHLAHGDYLGPCFNEEEGTIAPYYSPPTGEVGNIGPELTSLLEQYRELGSVPSNDIYMISGDKVLIEIIIENLDIIDVEAFISDLEDTYGAEVYEDYGYTDDFILTVLFPIGNLDALNNYPGNVNSAPC